MRKTSKQRPVRMPSFAEDRVITAAAKRDPDAPPLTTKQLGEMVPLRKLRGRPPAKQKKMLVSVRYSPEVIEFFRATGSGWQARMDGILRRYVIRHAKKQ
ncbi:MAG: BrnA antitoxin family protein [Pirellulales bacterium]|jgi:uncharacterized protein (DUF4415 family)